MLNALAIVLVIYFTIAAARIAGTVGKEKTVFEEFKQSQVLKVLVWFFPLAPLLTIVGPYFLPFDLAFVLCIACYIPGLLAARKCIASFERAGTDRVNRAQAAASQALGNAIGGLVFSAAVLVIVLAGQVYAPGD